MRKRDFFKVIYIRSRLLNRMSESGRAIPKVLISNLQRLKIVSFLSIGTFIEFLLQLLIKERSREQPGSTPEVDETSSSRGGATSNNNRMPKVDKKKAKSTRRKYANKKLLFRSFSTFLQAQVNGQSRFQQLTGRRPTCCTLLGFLFIRFCHNRFLWRTKN